MAGSSLTRSAPLVLALLFVTDAQLPTGTSEETDSTFSFKTPVRAAVGGTVVLRCDLPDTGNYVYWARQRRDNVMMTQARRLHFTARFGRLEASCSWGGDVCMLTIRNVEKTDSGFYYCADDSKPPFQHSWYLSVSEPVTTILGEPFRAHWQGSTVNLTCEVQPQLEPEDTVLWMHDEMLIDPEHDSRVIITTETDTSTISQLLVEDAQPEDAGTYTCKLPNGSNDSVEVVVMEEPVTTILGEHFRVHRQGSAIVLTCKVHPRREPEDTVLWMHDDLLIDSDDDSRITITTETDTSTISHLLIEDAQAEDSGNYTCELPNGGSDSVDVDVMEAFRDDFYPTMSGAQRPLAAVPSAGLLALAVVAAACSSHCR